ncbi:MAG: FAD-dependent oxidoreductase, partial [Solirubrobacteraceae bacterium]|nr:FAD-dependent oxidoreductase [Solirubrobacteraceae bacterium]
MSDRRLDAIVVGAGICGLAAAVALTRRGARVLVLERAGVGAEQSAGLARIFRVAHLDPRRCALALEARDGWRRWERDLGAGRLLGDEGLAVLGPGVRERQGAAMGAAAAPWEPLAADAAAERVPALAAGHPFGDGLWDPLAGSIRVRRTLRALAARVEVRTATVRAVAGDGDAARVELADGTVLRAGHAVVCAGTETPGLAAGAGIELPMRFAHHVRLTYAARGAAAGR